MIESAGQNILLWYMGAGHITFFIGQCPMAILIPDFQEKLTIKIFKFSKKSYFGGHFGPFLSNFGQKWVLLDKRALSVFRYFNYLPSLQKLEKVIEQFLIKTPNWRANRWTEGQTVNSDFTALSVGQGSNILV